MARNRQVLSNILKGSQRRQSTPLAGLLAGITGGVAGKQISDLDAAELANEVELNEQRNAFNIDPTSEEGSKFGRTSEGSKFLLNRGEKQRIAEQLQLNEAAKRQTSLQDQVSKEDRAQSNKIALALNPDVNAAKLALKRAGKTDINVNTGQPVEGFSPMVKKELAKQDVKTIGQEREAASQSESLLSALNEADRIINSDDFESGLFQPIKGNIARIQSGLGLGDEKTDKSAANFEVIDSISQQLGADALKAFGGSDTEKELQVALRTTVNPSKTVEANKLILKRQHKAANVLQQKPDFNSEWLLRNGSLAAKDIETGENRGDAWRRFQRESFSTDEVIEPNQNTGFSQDDEAELKALEEKFGGR